MDSFNIPLEQLNLEVLGVTNYTKKKVWYTVKAGVSGDDCEVPVTIGVVRGCQSGPTIYVGGAAHSDEIGGAEVASRLVEILKPEKLTGTVIVVPLQDPLAIRYSYWSGGRLDGVDRHTDWVHEALSRLALKCSAIIDIHCPSFFNIYKPTAYVPVAENMKPYISLARALSVRFTIEFKGEGLIQEAARNKIPAVIYEFGEGGRRNSKDVRLAVKAIERAIAYLGNNCKEECRSGELSKLKVEPIHIVKTIPVYACASGFPEYMVAPGEQLRAGAIISEINSIRRARCRVVAPADSWLLNTSSKPYLNLRDRVALLGLLEN